MTKVIFSDGTKVSVDGVPTPDEIEEIAAQIKDGNMQPEQIGVSLKAKVGIGAGLLGGAAAYGIFRPDLQIQKQGLLNQLNNIQNMYNLQNPTRQGIVPALGGKMAEANIAKQVDLSNYKANVNKLTNQLNLQKQTIDNSILTADVSDLANVITKGKSAWMKSASDIHAAGLDRIDTELINRGITLSNQQVRTGFIDKVIKAAEAQGVDAKQLKYLLSFGENLDAQSKLLSAKGNPLPTEVRLSDIKSAVSNIVKDDPYNNVSAITREKWADFLEEIAPKDIKYSIKGLNASYKPFAQARATLNNLSKSASGETDTRALTQYLLKYAKTNIDSGTKELMQILGGSSPGVKGIPGVTSKFAKLSSTAQQRAGVISQLANIRANSPAQENAIRQKALAKINDILAWKNKAALLNSRIDELERRIPSYRPISKMLGKLGAVSKVLVPVSTLLQANELNADPGSFINSLMFLPSLPGEPGSKERFEAWQRANMI